MGGEHAGSPSEHGAAAHESEHEEGPGPVNWTDFDNKEQPPYLAALVNFAILVIIYVGFGKKPIAEALKARRQEVSKEIEEAQKIKREAEARSKQYTSKLEDLGQELESTKAALAAAGAGEKARIVKEAEEKAVRMEKDADFLLEQERKQLAIDLRREAVLAALTSAEQILRTKLTQADQERMAEEFLSTLTPAKTAASATTSGGGVS
jgi:F-type H+-transporting ATPase subunit b